MGNKNDSRFNLKAVLYGLCISTGLYILYFALLGRCPLMDPDEPVYGQVAKEMAAGVGWLTPHYNGGMWFDKPPLFYWLSGISAHLLNPTEGAVRLPSAILAVALLFLVYKLASYDFGRKAGILSAVVLATCIQQIVLARASVTDMTLVVCLTSALYAYRRWLDAQGRSRFGWIAACGIMTGLGMLAKGPVAPILLFSTFAIHLWRSGRLRQLLSIDVGVCILATLMVGLPWYIAMYTMHRDAFVQGFLVANNIVRFLKPEHAETTGGWYSYFLNIPILLIFFFPWSTFLPQGMARSWNKNDGANLAAIWILVVFAFFSISKTILVTYIFPLYPAAAVFVGVLWHLAASGDDHARRGLISGLFGSLMIALLITVGLQIGAKQSYPDAKGAALVLGVIVSAAMAVGLLWVLTRKGAKIAYGAWIIGGGMAFFTMWLMAGVLPYTTSQLSTKALAARLPHNARIASYELNLKAPSLLFYLDYQPEHLTDVSKAHSLLSGKAPVLIICKESYAAQVAAEGSVEYARSGGLVAIVNSSAATLERKRSR